MYFFCKNNQSLTVKNPYIGKAVNGNHIDQNIVELVVRPCIILTVFQPNNYHFQLIPQIYAIYNVHLPTIEFGIINTLFKRKHNTPIIKEELASHTHCFMKEIEVVQPGTR